MMRLGSRWSDLNFDEMMATSGSRAWIKVGLLLVPDPWWPTLNKSMSEPPGIAPEATTASSTAGSLRQSSSVWSPAVYNSNSPSRIKSAMLPAFLSTPIFAGRIITQVLREF